MGVAGGGVGVAGGGVAISEPYRYIDLTEF